MYVLNNTVLVVYMHVSFIQRIYAEALLLRDIVSALLSHSSVHILIQDIELVLVDAAHKLPPNCCASCICCGDAAKEVWSEMEPGI